MTCPSLPLVSDLVGAETQAFRFQIRFSFVTRSLSQERMVYFVPESGAKCPDVRRRPQCLPSQACLIPVMGDHPLFRLGLQGMKTREAGTPDKMAADLGPFPGG